MDITPEMRAIIQGLPGPSGPAAPVGGGFGRVAQNIANLPGNIIEGLGQGVATLAQIGNLPEHRQNVELPNFFDIAPPQTTGDMVGDFFVGKHGLADMMAQILLPAGALGRVGKGLGMAEGMGLDALRFAAGESIAQAGVPEVTGTDIGVAGLVGGAQAPAAFLPMRARLPIAAAIAAAHGLYENEQRGALAGGVTAGADFLSGLMGLPGTPNRPRPEIQTGPISRELALRPDTSPVVMGGTGIGPNVDVLRETRRGHFGLQGEPLGRPYAATDDVIYQGDFQALPGRTLALPASPDNAKFRVATELGFGYGQSRPLTPPAAALPTPAQSMRNFQYPELFATLQKAGEPQIRMPNLTPERLPLQLNPPSPLPVVAASKPRGRKVKVQEAPVEKPVQPKMEEQVKWTSQEQAYKRNLTNRYNKLNENEIRETVLDLDNEIANSGDEASIRGFRLAREAATDVLESRKAPTTTPTASAPKKAADGGIKPKRGAVVGYRDEMGGIERATIKGFDNASGTVRLVFEGSSQEATVPRSRLVEAPDKKIATLQKPDADDIESASIGENLEAIDENMRRVDVSEIERQQERVPGRVRENQAPEDLHAEKYARTGVGPDIEIPFPAAKPYLEAKIKTKLTKIINEVLRKVNPNLEAKFVDALKGKIARNIEFGNIEINEEVIAGWFRDWPTMSEFAQAQTMAKFSQVIAHEAAHSALLWVRANNPKMYKDLIKEFQNLSEDGRKDIISKFWQMIGKNPRATADIEYFAGTRAGMIEGYGLHPRATEALDDFGMEEFFAEMFSAHVLGLLDEAKLPKEMSRFWHNFKEIVYKILNLFNPRKWDDGTLDVDEQASFAAFHEMIEKIGDGFRRSNEDDYYRSMGKGSAMRDREWDLFYGKSKRFIEEDVADQKARVAAIKKKEKGEEYQGDPNYDITIDYGVTERAARAKGMPAPGPTLKAAFQRELVQELGSSLAGAIIGGVTGPDLTDGQLSMSEGILMGGVLGAMGPRALKSLLAVPKSTGSVFHHKTFAEALAGVFRGNAEAVAADAATGHGSSIAKFMRFLERNANLHLPPELFTAVTQADGAAAWALHTVDDAFKKARHYEPTPHFEAATLEFLRGKTDSMTYKAKVATLGDVKADAAASFYSVSREAIATLQKHFAEGLPSGTFKDMILKSIADGSYLTRQYRIFHDPKYRPTQAQIEAVAQKYVADHPTIDMDAARSIIENYIHEIKTAGADYRGSVTDVGKKLDSYLWEKRENLDPMFRDMLGEYHDPREKVLGTIQHIYTSAITGKLIDTVSNLKDKLGLHFSYGMEQHSKEIDRLKAQIMHKTPPPGKSLATLQKELDTLKAYVPLDGNKRYGKLANKMVSRFVRDQLATFDSPWGLLDGTIMRSLAKFHNAVKIARAPLNPITVVRNIIAMPILTAVGGANPLSIPRVFKMLQKGGPEVQEMLEQGVLNVDAIRGEMMRNVDYVRMLDIDNSITGLVKKGVNKALDFYRWPDMLVRATTYMTAKAKFAKELGLPETHADVIAKARDWTNRYTVNYANVAPIVKTLRQIPFTNLFISYTAEITRISKNLVQDMFKHDDPGQRVRAAGILGGLASLPFAFEKFATLQLSEKDRKDWEKARKLMPDYQRTKHLIVTGREKDGRFRYFDMTPLIQVDALTQMGRAIATGDTAALAAVNPVVSWENTPAINIVAEQLTGEDLRSGRPIDKNLLTRAKAVLDDVVPPILPGGYEYRRWSEALSRTETGDLGTTNARTGRRTTPGEIVSSYLTGMRFGTLDANKLSQFAVADARRAIANEQAYLRDVIQTNSTQRVKEKAIERYREAQKHILLELTQKLQPPD